MIRQKTKTIVVDVSKKNIEQIISNEILKDFNNFKNTNELVYCTLHQEKPIGNSIDTTFSTTLKYKDKFVDTNKLLADFNQFQEENKEDFCQITKTSHQDGTLLAEFTVRRTYLLKFI